LITYLVLKLALAGVIDECNRLAAEQFSREYANALKARLIRLTTDYESGLIDAKTFERAERELQDEMYGGLHPMGGV
jgi:hypothetical protein